MSHTVVDVGIGSSYDFFFEIAWPNYQEVARNPSPTSALNAAWPFWHLHEWHFWENHPSAANDDLRRYVDRVLLRDCPEIAWLRDIAEAGKHFRLNRTNPPVRVRSISVAEEFSAAIGDAPLGTVPIGGGSGPELFVEVGGHTHKLQHALGTAFRYWLGKVLPHHVETQFSPDELPQRSESMLDWCRDRMGDERVRKWRWALLKGANAPDYIQRLIFLEEDTADAFRRHFRL